MNIIPNEEWQDPAKPVNGPAPRGEVTDWIVHYPGSPHAWEPLTYEECKAWCLSTQSYYVDDRGYSCGYGWAVFQSGLVFEIRGDDFNNAANSGKKVSGNANDWTQAIIVVVGGQNVASPAAIASINELISSKAGRGVDVHLDIDYTSCCGSGMIPQVRSGVIGYNGGTTPPPDPPPVEGYNPPDDWGLFPLDSGKPTLKKGSSGDHVRYLQDVIYFFGHGDITRDGQFGSETERRVKDVQSLFGFPAAYVDGIVGWSTNAPEYATWAVIDYMVELNTAPPPVDPPPATGVEAVNPAAYYIVSGDSPWSVSETVYGSGTHHDRLDSSKFNGYSTPGNPVFVDTPGVAGARTQVLAGEGPAAIIRRLVGDDSYPSEATFEKFYDWNGGWERNFLPGDVVNYPA